MSGSDSDSDWSDVVDDEKTEELLSTSCLFCDKIVTTTNGALDHILNNHDINLKGLLCSMRMDFYSYIKFINFVRKNKVSPQDVKSLKKDAFDDDQWLKPIIEDDLLLTLDVDSILESEMGEEVGKPECLNLESKLSIAEERAKLAEEFLERTLDDLNKCRTELKNILLGDPNLPNTVSSIKEEDSEGYFSSYAHYGIHEEMLKDKVRTEAYRDFIIGNPRLFHGANVLDIGCGTSILSMFTAKAGAKKVTAVDYSEVAYQAMDIVKQNDLSGVIQVVKRKAEDLELKEKVDVILSEWMGYFLLFESMLDTVLYCRDRYLTENGCIYPDKCDIQLVALADDKLYEKKVMFWNEVYGFKMNCMKSSVLEEPLVEIVDSSKIVSNACTLKKFDLMKITTSELDFDSGFQLKITTDAKCSAFVGFFDIYFERNASTPISFSTSPFSTATHWKQTIFLLKEPLDVHAGDVINGRMMCKKNKKDHRALDIAIFLYDGDYQTVTSVHHYVIS